MVFLTVVLPVNSRFPVHGSGAVPAGWAGLRDRWEAGHAAGFVLFTVAFIMLALAALRPARHEPCQVSRPAPSLRTPG
jgi:hypothetical protein